MPKFQNPGALFMGTLVSQEQKFLKPLLENARKAGYTRVVEPCAGAFAMSHLAVQAGFKGEQIEASDVAMFTSIMGYAIMGKTLEDLEIKAEGFTDEEMKDPATALFAQKKTTSTIYCLTCIIAVKSISRTLTSSCKGQGIP